MVENRSMPAPRRDPAEITPVRLAYAAGLIDGEGCIGIYHNSHNGNYHIAVEMVDSSGLEELHNLFGGRWYFKPATDVRRGRCSWMVFNSAAENALRLVLPYLRVKRPQAELGLTTQWGPRSQQFRRLPRDEQATRARCHEIMRTLNQTGPGGRSSVPMPRIS